MIILTSNGLSSNILIEECKKILSGARNAVIVTTASVGYKEKDKHIPHLKSELEQFGLIVDFFDFDTQDAEALLSYDVIEINGGNPFYLLRAMKSKKNIKDVLEKSAREKIVIGISAGAVVLQKNINLIAQYSPELNDNIGILDLTGFSLTDIEILPHYSRFINKFENFEQRANSYEEENNCHILRIDDGEAVFDYGNNSELIIKK